MRESLSWTPLVAQAMLDRGHDGDLLSAGGGDIVGDAENGDGGLGHHGAGKQLGIPQLFLDEALGDRMSGLQRLMATANGNLQRIVSSWTNRPVQVNVLLNQRTAGSGKPPSSPPVVCPLRMHPEHLIPAGLDDKSERYERRVELVCDGKIFCEAESVVLLTEDVLITAVQSGRVGLGQLFREFDLLPMFHLVGVELNEQTDTGLAPLLCRKYTLRAHGILCTICEEIDVSALPEPHPLNKVLSSCKNGSAGNFGDLMRGTETAVTLSVLNDTSGKELSFIPFERVLLTANGNVQRLISSFLNCPIGIEVRQQGTRLETNEEGMVDRLTGSSMVPGIAIATYLRAVALCRGNQAVCKASSRIEVFCEALDKRIQRDEAEIERLFGVPGEPDALLPQFELLSFKQLDFDEEFSLQRNYRLKSPTVWVTITESFHRDLFNRS